MRILLIEDDESLIELLTRVLTEQQYVVDVALDGKTGWELAQVYPYSLILLDVNRPELDGITLCRRLRDCHIQTLVMVLTAHDSITDRIVGLNSGADDYVVKPFDIHELLARMRALIRRGTTSPSSRLTCGSLALDPIRRDVTCEGQPFSVSRKEYLLIELFLRHQKRVFSRNDIIDHLWAAEEEPPTQETVKSHIKSLRQKLKQVGAADWIETLYGQGYRVNPKYLGEYLSSHAAETELLETAATDALNSKLQEQLRAIAQDVWQQTQQISLDRVASLETAVTSLHTHHWDDAWRSHTIREAHQLAGTLGTFGLDVGSQVAQQIKGLLQSETDFTLLESQLKASVNALRSAVSESQTILTVEQFNGVVPFVSAQAPHQQARILQVDADPQILLLANSLFSFLGLYAMGLKDTSQFWETLQATCPDLVILDNSMPEGNLPEINRSENNGAENNRAEISGVTLCRAIRQHPDWHWLPVIILTAQGDGMTEQQVFAAGADDYLSKPVRPENLVLRVLNRLQRSRSRQRSPKYS